MKILKVSAQKNSEIIKEATKTIKGGGVLIFPTDTVYGLITNATNKKAVEKIFKIKERRSAKFLPIFVGSLKRAKKLAKINKKQEEFLKTAWPGKITAILERKKMKFQLYGVDRKTIALRQPKHKLLLDLIKKLDCPLTATSANISGIPASTKIKEVIKQFKKAKPDLIINEGNLPKSKPSIVVDLTLKYPKILRK